MVFSMTPDDGAPGWAGTVECAMRHVAAEDEVVLLPCDNYQMAARIEPIGRSGIFLFTYTRSPEGGPSTSGPIFGRAEGEETWQSRAAAGFSGDVFTGYAVVRGGVLREVLQGLPTSPRGEKEMTSLLAQLASTFGTEEGRAVPYLGDYLDVADLPALARIDARLRGGPAEGPVDVGCGVVLLDRDPRVLLTERQDGLGWVPPGGLCDPGEDYAAAAARELREEVGCEIPSSRLRLLGVYPTAGKDGRPAVSVMFWRRDVIVDSFVGYDRREVRSEPRWHTREEAAGVTIPFGLRVAVEDAFTGREIDCR